MKMLNLPSFRDGRLTGIKGGTPYATLALTTDKGDEYQLDLIGVEGLRVDDFKEGNIILELRVIGGRDPSAYDFNRQMDRLDPTPGPNVDRSYHDARSARVEKTRARIIAGGAALVSIISSYGCDLVSLCSSVALRGPAPRFDQYGRHLDSAERYQGFMLRMFDTVEEAREAGFSEEATQRLNEARLLFLDEFETKFPGFGEGRAVWR
jgi:hypothetical protein